MIMLVLYQAVPATFYNKIAPMYYLMMSKRSYSWCIVSVLVSIHGVCCLSAFIDNPCSVVR